MEQEFMISIHDNGSGERVTITFDTLRELYTTGDVAEDLAHSIIDALGTFRSPESNNKS